MDGGLFGEYLKAKVRGISIKRPESKEIKFFIGPN
jgi:hypothetical protein